MLNSSARALFIVTAIAAVPIPAQAFNVSTHRRMNQEATSASALDTTLKSVLAFSAGINAMFGGLAVADWIQYGAEREDDFGLVPRAPGRFMAHFHDPLVDPWTVAGLDETASSAVWMQADVNDWSWQEVRQEYYWALTSGSATRDYHWANTFRGIGQIMHLVEDAAVPEHVRNDAHGDEYVCRHLYGLKSCHGNFEYWVEDHAGAFGYSGASPFDRNILYQPTGHPEALLPLARLIDTDTYDGSDPSVTIGPAIGLGEFTNANFFSEDTIPGPRQYPHPNVSTLMPTWQVNLTANTIRQYYEKAPDDGLQVGPVAVASVFGDICPLYSVDGVVWGATAGVVVPKAVDYAQGALDYFFRGRIDFVPDPNDPNGYLIKNLGPEDLNGTFELYYDDAGGNRQLVPGANQWQLTIPAAAHCQSGTPCNQASVQAFNVAFEAPLGATYTLVFQGAMGNEAPNNGSLGAVAGRVVRGAGFLCVDDNGAFQSVFLDHGWQRVAGNWVFSTAKFGTVDAYVSQQLLIAGGQISTDNGHIFRDATPGVNASLGTSWPGASITYSGGTSLFALLADPTCWLGYWQSHSFPCWPSGIAYSTDLGATWTLVPQQSDVAFDWVAYIGDNTLVGKGWRFQDRSNFYVPQYDWYASADGGVTWQPALGETFAGVAALPIIPTDTGGILTTAIWIDDAYGGFAWNQRTGPNRILLDVGTVYEAAPVGTWQILGSGVYRSINGVDWQLVLDAYPAATAVGLAADGSALFTNYPVNGNRATLSKSTDGGLTWRTANPPPGLSANGCNAIVSLQNEVDQTGAP